MIAALSRTLVPIVLLGIRSSLKEDIGCTSAELVYGVPLRLSGSFFTSPLTSPTTTPTADYIRHLTQTMSNFRPVPPRSPSHRIVYVNPDLFQQSHVFLRRDSICRPLQSPFDGPYRVISRMKKHFSIDVRGKHEIVSVDRLKPAHLEHMPTPIIPKYQTPLPPQNAVSPVNGSHHRTTRSGRSVRFPDRLTM